MRHIYPKYNSFVSIFGTWFLSATARPTKRPRTSPPHRTQHERSKKQVSRGKGSGGASFLFAVVGCVEAMSCCAHTNSVHLGRREAGPEGDGAEGGGLVFARRDPYVATMLVRSYLRFLLAYLGFMGRSSLIRKSRTKMARGKTNAGELPLPPLSSFLRSAAKAGGDCALHLQSTPVCGSFHRCEF